MNRLLLVLVTMLSLLQINNAFGQNYIHEWSFSIGNASDNTSEMIVSDNNNNQYFVGDFQGTVDFDPGVGVNNMTAISSFDEFLVKVDDQGNFIWSRHFPVATIFDIQFDAANNLYIIGTFENTVDFDPGISTFNLSSNGSLDAFLLKLDASGNFIHAISFGGISADQPFSIDLDENENVYVTGQFANTVDFNPGPSLFELTSAGDTDSFLAKYGSNLDFQWVMQMGGTVSDGENANLTYNNGYVYFTGVFRGTADINPTAVVQSATSAGDRDIYIGKIDTTGAFVWVYAIGGPFSDSPRDIKCDNAGNVLVTGHYRGTVDFDPGAGTSSFASVGFGSDSFILKLDASGDYLWNSSFGSSTASDNTRTMAIDSLDNIYTVGWFSGNGDFDPGAGTTTLTSAGSNDAYLLALNANGDFVNVYQFSGASSILGRSNSIDDNGNIYVFGSFNGSVDTDPGTAVNTLNSNGSGDIYVVKLANCNDVTTDLITACDSYTWIDGNTYNANNNSAQVLLQNQAGCDSLVSLDLTINASTFGTDVLSDCDPILWIDGNVYNQSNNTATFVITNQAGCDSTVTLNFTLLSNEVNDVQVACDSLTWIDGITYTSDNTSASFTLTNSNGCDSLVTLDLTIIDNNPTLMESGGILTASTAGVLYQWVSCDNSFIEIPNETSQSFQPTVNGEYAVVVSENNCSDTSDCFLVDYVGLDELSSPFFHVYPNPTSGVVTVKSLQNGQPFSIDIYTVEGKKMYSKTQLLTETQLVLPEQKAVYILHLSSEETTTTLRVIKQ